MLVVATPMTFSCAMVVVGVGHGSLGPRYELMAEKLGRA